MSGTVVIDDVLEKEDFEMTQGAIMHDQFDWQFRKGIKDASVNDSQMVHTFHFQGMQATTPERFSILYPLMVSKPSLNLCHFIVLISVT